MNPNAAAIYVVGAGVDPGRHLTIEAIEVLGACKEIRTNVPIDIFRRLPEALRLALRSLSPFYKEKQPRRQNYADVTQPSGVLAQPKPGKAGGRSPLDKQSDRTILSFVFSDII
jgi:hypothetical protein